MRFREQVRQPAWQRDFLARPLSERTAIARDLREQSEARKRSTANDPSLWADVDASAARAALQAAGAHTLIHGHTHRPALHALGDGLQRVVLSDWDAAAHPPRAEVLRLDAQGLRRIPLPLLMIDLLQRLLPRSLRQPTPVPDALWQSTLAAHPFLSALDSTEQDRLRLLCTHFLAEKEFHGANDLVLTDAMALAIAAQACLPLLHMHGTSGEPVRDPLKLLDWYGDFVGIVVQPGAVVARRKTTDGAGVVHHYNEVLAGEAMDRGPLMLSWEEVAHASVAAESGSNVVIHEFVHKMDMRGISLGEHPDGAPPLPKGFLGTRSASDARELWRDTMQHRVRCVPRSGGHGRALRRRTPLARRLRGQGPRRVFCRDLRGLLREPANASRRSFRRWWRCTTGSSDPRQATQ